MFRWKISHLSNSVSGSDCQLSLSVVATDMMVILQKVCLTTIVCRTNVIYCRKLVGGSLLKNKIIFLYKNVFSSFSPHIYRRAVSLIYLVVICHTRTTAMVIITFRLFLVTDSLRVWLLSVNHVMGVMVKCPWVRFGETLLKWRQSLVLFTLKSQIVSQESHSPLVLRVFSVSQLSRSLKLREQSYY